jgi:hypothetical protein
MVNARVNVAEEMHFKQFAMRIASFHAFLWRLGGHDCHLLRA